MTNTYLRYFIIGLLFLTPLVGFVVSTSLFFPYITGKTLFFRLIIEAAFVLYAILALKAPEYRPRLSSVTIAFAAFIAVIFAADIFGVYPFKSFWSNFERMEGFVTHIHLFAYFIMMSALFTGEKIWTRFFQASLAASVIMGLISFNPDRIQAGRTFANLGNSSYLGIYMLFHMFIAGFLLVRIIERQGDIGRKWLFGCLYGAVILFDFFVFYNTGTRGALLGLLAGALFTSVLFAIWEKNKGLRMLGISVLLAIILAVGSLAIFRESTFIRGNPLLSRFAALANFDTEEISKFATTQGKSRFGIWGIAIEGFKERPVLGWGQDNFNYVFNEYYDPKIYDQEQWFDRAHNVFLDWLIAGGILGLLSYLALFAAAIVAIWRSRAHEKDLYFLFSDKVLLTALLIAYFIHNLFVFDSLTSYILFFGVLAFVSIHDKNVLASPTFEKPIKNEGYLMAGNVIIVIVGAVSLYYFTIAPYVSGKTLIKALSYQSYASRATGRASADTYQASLDAFSKALSYDNVTGASEAREQLIQGTSNALLSTGATDTIKSEYLEKLRVEMKKQLETTPPDTRHYLLYGSFLARLGGSASTTEFASQGIENLKKAVELSPRKQSALFELGAAYINSRQYKEAVQPFKKAFDEEPGFDNARFFYGLSLVYAGDNKAAEEILKPLDGSIYPGDYRLLRAYYDTKQTAKLSAALRYKIEYAKKMASQGNIEGAIAEINQAIQLSPQLKAEGERIIEGLQAL